MNFSRDSTGNIEKSKKNTENPDVSFRKTPLFKAARNLAIPAGNSREISVFHNSSFPVFLNCSRESREVPEFIVPTLIEKNTNFFG